MREGIFEWFIHCTNTHHFSKRDAPERDPRLDGEIEIKKERDARERKMGSIIRLISPFHAYSEMSLREICKWWDRRSWTVLFFCVCVDVGVKVFWKDSATSHFSASCVLVFISHERE